jgi:hypothetical protein
LWFGELAPEPFIRMFEFRCGCIGAYCELDRGFWW